MIERFQIEDIVVQDSSGILFRALDTSNGQPVALRRLFPNGPEGAGLDAAGQADYQAAVERLSSISHPALRSILWGGCDPVDGMPFIVTEWIEGNRLQAFLDHAPLKPEEAADLLTKALEVGELLENVLGQQGVWIETGPNTIVVGAEESGRGVTFWVSPLRWLARDKPQGLHSIATLAETVMGWTGRTMPDQAGRGLGGWLRWLRGAADTATLPEAREKLAASLGPEAPAPTKGPLRQPQPTRKATPVTAVPKKSSGLPVFVISILFLGVVAGAGWLLVKRNSESLAKIDLTAKEGSSPVIVAKTDIPAGPSPSKEERAETATNESDVRTSDIPPAAARPGTNKTTGQTGATPTDGKIFTPGDRDQIATRSGQKIVLEGSVGKVDFSGSGNTLYVLFTGYSANRDTRGAISVKKMPAGMSKDELSPLVGKKVRLHGKVRIEPQGRPVIDLEERGAIVVEE